MGERVRLLRRAAPAAPRVCSLLVCLPGASLLGAAGCGSRVRASAPSVKEAPVAHVTQAVVLPATMPATLASTGPATAPVATVALEDVKNGFRLAYPSDWRRRTTDEYTVMLVPVEAAANGTKDGDLAGSKITVDVPSLPPHLPGMITINRVENGYVDDQKDRFADFRVVEKTDPSVPQARCRRLVLSGHAKRPDGSAGPAYTVVTLLEIHANRVYLFSAEARDEDYPAVRAAFDAVIGSTQWVK